MKVQCSRRIVIFDTENCLTENYQIWYDDPSMRGEYSDSSPALCRIVVLVFALLLRINMLSACTCITKVIRAYTLKVKQK